MINAKRLCATFTLVILAVISPAVMAVPECFEESASLTELGDKYFESMSAELSRKDARKLKSVLRAVSGTWTGETVYLTCRGNAIHNEEVFDDGAVDVQLERREDGGISIRSVVDYHTGKKNVAIDYQSGAADKINTVRETARGIIISEKYYREGQDDSDLVENTIDIRTKDESLTLVYSTYVNGLLESSQIFGVTRKSSE